MKINYLEYHDNDREKLLELIEKLQDYIVSLDTFDRVIRRNDFGQYYTDKILNQIKDNGGKIFLAKDSIKVIGVVIAVIVPRSKEDDLQIKFHKYGEIEKLLVLESYRSLGIGECLFGMAEKYLTKEEKCDFIEVVVFGDNKKALTMYQRNGYKEKEFVLLKKVN